LALHVNTIRLPFFWFWFSLLFFFFFFFFSFFFGRYISLSHSRWGSKADSRSTQSEQDPAASWSAM
jgi:hypothetical protein